MFKKLGKLKNSIIKKEIKISLDEIKSGDNFFENFIIFKDENDLKIYDRTCDHAGGKIISKNGKTICPIHMWKFNPSTGQYDNGVKKKELDYSINQKIVKIEDASYVPVIDRAKKNLKTEVRFFNHAFLKIS